MSSDSVWSSESVDTQQLNDIQGEILTKSKQIEDFIKKMKKIKGKSDSFQFLETLFALFKSEVQVNISLRQAILKQQQEYKDEITNLKQNLNPQPFFDELSRISQRDICDFNCALDLFSEISTIFLNAKEKLKNKLKDAKSDNEKLIQYGKEMQDNYEQLENQMQDQNNIQFELQQKLEEANNYNNSLNSRINELTKENEELKRNTEESKKTLQNKVDYLSKTLQALRTELNEVTEQLQTHQLQLAYETSQTEEATNKLNNEKSENEKLILALEKLAKKEKEKKKIISELKKENNRLQNIANGKESELTKIHQKEMANLKKNLEVNINSKICDIQAAIKDKDDKLKQLKVSLQETSRKLNQAEKTARDQFQISMKYKEENERLREMMRRQNSVNNNLY